jgi:preprotein translocase subunit SecE
MSKTSPAEFIRQVRQEASKVTWGTRKETLTSTGIVLVMIMIAAGFFWLADVVIFNIIEMILGL